MTNWNMKDTLIGRRNGCLCAYDTLAGDGSLYVAIDDEYAAELKIIDRSLSE